MKKSVQFIVFFVASLLLGNSACWAVNTVGETFTSGNYTYKILTAAKTTGSAVANRGTCSVKAKDTSISGALTISAYVSNNSYCYNITEVASSGFSECSGVTSVSIGSNVTKINNYAFKGTTITSVTIPATVTSIGMDAFQNCTSLTTATFNASSPLTAIGTYLFEGCTSLTNVTLPPQLTTLPVYTFKNCSTLVKVEIPASVTTVTNTAFSGCTSLKTIVCHPTTAPTVSAAFNNITPANVDVVVCTNSAKTSYKAATGWKDMNVTTALSGSCGDNATWSLELTTWTLTISGIGAMADYNSSSNKSPWASYASQITSIQVKDGITAIGKYAFYNCSAATKVTISSTVTSIGTSAFYGCSALTRVNYQKNYTTTLTYVDDWASIDFDNSTANPLYYAKDLYVVKTTSTMPALSKVTSLGFKNSPTITEIKKYAFYNCTALTSVIIPYTITTIGSSAFYGCANITTVMFGTNATMQCNVTSIAAGAFSNCTSIANVYCWGGLEKWMNINFATQVAAPFYASTAATKKFYIDNVETTEIVVPENITSIDAAAFAGMSSLTKISIPATMTNIHRYAFAKCTGLQEIVSLAFEAPTIEVANTFEDVPTNIPIFVPSEEAKTNYEAAATWKSFINIIPLSGSCGDNLTWSYSWSMHTLEIAGEGEMFNYNSTHAPWYDFAGDIQTIIIGENVTKIGSMAFRYCNNVTALYYNAINATVSYTASGTSSNQSFYELGKDGAGFTCYVGPQVTALPNEMFCPAVNGGQSGVSVYGRPKLIGIVFSEPSACTTIGSQAFLRATDLTQITLPATITSIGNSAFDNCSNLTRTDYTGTIAQWCNVTFDNSSANPIYYTNNLYIDNTLVTELEVPEGVTEVKSFAFAKNTKLTSVTLPTTLTLMGSSVFDGCSNVTTVTSQATVVPTITANTFPAAVTNNATLIVPAVAESAYRTAIGWQNFANIKPYGEVWETIRTGITNGQIGTQCVAYPIKGIRGAEIYRLSDKETTDGDDPLNVTIAEDLDYASRVAGTPFIFRADGSNDGNMDLLLDKTDDPVAVDINENGLIGLLSQEEKEILNNGTNLLLSGGALWIARDYCYVAKNRAYIDFNSIIPEVAPVAARRLTLRRGDATTTEVSNIRANTEDVYKVLRNGQLVIIKDGESYSVLGQSIK